MSNYIAVKTDKIDIKQINKKLAINLLALSNSDNIHEALDEWIEPNVNRIKGITDEKYKKMIEEHNKKLNELYFEVNRTKKNQDYDTFRCLCGGCAMKTIVLFNKNKDNHNKICVANGNKKSSCIRYFNKYKRIKISDATPEELTRYTKDLQKFNHSQLMSHWGFNKLSFIHSKILLKEHIYFKIPYVEKDKFKGQFGGEWDHSIGKWFLNYNTKLNPIEFKKLLELYDFCHKSMP